MSRIISLSRLSRWDSWDGFFFRDCNIRFLGLVYPSLDRTLPDIHSLCNLADGHTIALHHEDFQNLTRPFAPGQRIEVVFFTAGAQDGESALN